MRPELERYRQLAALLVQLHIPTGPWDPKTQQFAGSDPIDPLDPAQRLRWLRLWGQVRAWAEQQQATLLTFEHDRKLAFDQIEDELALRFDQMDPKPTNERQRQAHIRQAQRQLLDQKPVWKQLDPARIWLRSVLTLLDDAMSVCRRALGQAGPDLPMPEPVEPARTPPGPAPGSGPGHPDLPELPELPDLTPVPIGPDVDLI